MLGEESLTNSELKLADGVQKTPISYEDAMENYRKNTDWWVIFAAFDLPDFQSSTIWISQKTGLSIETVVEALEGLETLGYLKNESGKYAPVNGKSLIKFETKNKDKAQVLSDHALISKQMLNHLYDNPMAAFEHRCFASNVEILRELYSDISKAFDRAYSASIKDKNKDSILKITFTATNVLPGKGQ